MKCQRAPFSSLESSTFFPSLQSRLSSPQDRRCHERRWEVLTGIAPPLPFATTTVSKRKKGDYGFNVFHNSNPQHGGSYARHERRMRDEEVEDFLRSVKGWVPVWRDGTTPAATSTAASKGNPMGTCAPGVLPSLDSICTTIALENLPPDPSQLQFGDEAIMKTFTFMDYNDAYLFMGRVWAFCYGCDKYPHVVWKGKEITVFLYSPSFKGLSKREARVAAFLNDQFNMLKKSGVQREKVKEGVVKRATVEEMMGEAVRKSLEAKKLKESDPVEEVRSGLLRWEGLLKT